MSLSLKKASCEADFRSALRFESSKTKANPAHWHSHIGGLIFDRYMFGSGASDFFDYGYLVLDGENCVGYVSIEAAQKSAAVDISLEEKYNANYAGILSNIINALRPGMRVRISANIRDRQLIDALEKLRFSKGEESRAQYVLNLSDSDVEMPKWETETFSLLKLDDVEERAYHSALATQQRISAKMYKALMDSPYYSNDIDVVIKDNETGRLAGYAGFWTDEESRCALIEPVATIDGFRRRGIMKRTLLQGLYLLKEKGYLFAYVSTEGDNIPARKLYESIGFKRYGRVFEYFINL